MESAANRRFWKAYAQLPPDIQRLARKKYQLWKRDPRHPSLRFEKIGKVWAARVGDDFRALAQHRGDTFYWFWIGNHDEYERLIRS